MRTTTVPQQLVTSGRKRRRALQALLIVLTMAVIAVLVRISGANSIAAHLFYLPIVYAGFVLGDWRIRPPWWRRYCGQWMRRRYRGAETRAVMREVGHHPARHFHVASSPAGSAIAMNKGREMRTR